MQITLEVLFTPAEFQALAGRDLSETVCVVFDVFRATSTIVTALANAARAIIPVAEISDALACRRKDPEILLAGERDGLRIRRELTGSIDFDLGNSPREFTEAIVSGKTIALTTTNGSRALRACAHAKEVLVGSFLNLTVTAEHLRTTAVSQWLLVCSGTGNQTAYEDVLGAGALAELIWPFITAENVADSAKIALEIYQQDKDNLLQAAKKSRNGTRLLSIPELREDVALCLQRDNCPLVAKLDRDRVINVSH